VLEIFRKKIKIRERGQTRDVPALEAMLLKFRERALNGDTRAATFLINWFLEVEARKERRNRQAGVDAAVGNPPAWPKA
jgi:hypothetical protein